jgi:hypothetical protein
VTLEHLNAGLQRAKDFPKLDDLLGRAPKEQSPEEMKDAWMRLLYSNKKASA